MKIIAIRGHNLASLSLPFEVNFQEDPLASAGLFAITGPTGAGKSTLLDALCLALFERTPRLNRVAGRADIPDVGEQSVSTSDPRTLLRRGATEGYAEVDYVGSDGVGYRARWMVRRAHGRANGKLQNSEMTLQRLADGQMLGDHRKTETLKVIEGTIGLSFEQFTRAVLLAQNDFAAFLKASDDERAELLQTLTGTDTFTQISIQAFQRMRDEKSALEQLNAQLKDQEPLSGEVREAKEAEVKSLIQQQEVMTAKRKGLEAHQQWFEQTEGLKQRTQAATDKLAAANAESAAAEPRLKKLKQVESVQPARPLIVEIDRLSADIKANSNAQEALTQKLNGLQQTVATQEQQLELAKLEMTTAEGAYKLALPQLDQAKTLDTEIQLRQPTLEEVSKSHTALSARWADESKKQTTLAASVISLDQSLKADQAWMGEHESLRVLAESWPRWEAYLSHASKLAERRESLGNDLKGYQTNCDKLLVSLNTATELLGEKRLALQKSDQAIGLINESVRAQDLETIAQKKSALLARREQLLQAAQLWQRIDEGRASCLSLEKQRLDAIQLRDQAITQLSEIEIALPKLDEDLMIKRRALEHAQLVASESVEALRQQLQLEAPCPVCGAVEHPYALQSPIVDAMLERLQSAVNEAQKAVQAMVQQRGALESQKKSLLEQLSGLESTLNKAVALLQENLATWANHGLHTELSAIDEARMSLTLSELELNAKVEVAGLEKIEAECRERLRQRDEAQIAHNQLAQQVQADEQALASLNNDLKTAQQQQATAIEQAKEVDVQLDEQLSALDPAFLNEAWKDRWRENATAFMASTRNAAEGWLQKREAIREAEGKLATLKGELDGLDLSNQQLKQRLDEASAQFGQLRSEQESAQKQRDLLFDGASVADVLKKFDASIESAKAKLLVAQNALQGLLTEKARIEESQRLELGRASELGGALTLVIGRFNEWLTQWPASGEVALSEQDVRELLTFDDDWLASERKALHEIDKRVVEAVTLLNECQRLVSQHELTRPADASLEQVQSALAALNLESKRVTDTLTSANLLLLQDDEKRQKTASVRASIEKQEAQYRIWAQLSELIGSADGKKFRNFAQQLTLDVLLGYANRHLESLSRRYRLERIKDSLGLLVVDQDMGDEMRSVHSLSGGESFLVSLALALALASLSSHRVKVESLFIDEGFGTLDADSLQVAMEALDKLQSQGRKVGVISHVQEMTERIGTRIEVKRGSGGVSRVLVT